MSDVEHWTKVILAHVAMSLGERPRAVRCRICGLCKALRIVAGFMVCAKCLRERLGYDGREVKRIGDGESVK
jgi:hypothetical protein